MIPKGAKIVVDCGQDGYVLFINEVSGGVVVGIGKRDPDSDSLSIAMGSAEAFALCSELASAGIVELHRLYSEARYLDKPPTVPEGTDS